MPILREHHNIPAVPVGSQVLDDQGKVTPEWAHYFRELSDLERHILDVEVLARRSWLPAIEAAGGDGTSGGYGVVTFGLDNDTTGANTPGKYGNVIFPGTPFIANLSCVTVPTTADAVFDVLISHDKGITFNTMFNSGNPFRFPMGSSVHVIEFNTIFNGMTLALDDLIRVDTLQSGSATGITGVIKWA